MTKSRQQAILRIALVVLVIALSVLLFVYRNKVSSLGAYGYPGIFLISMLANASIILPVPGVVITSAMGAVFNPYWVALAAGTGAALGELSGYLAGYGGQTVIKDSERYRKLTGWMRKYGDLTILVLSAVPNPMFDLAGITAGALKLPLYRFLFWCWIGKLLKMLFFALFGAGILEVFK
jgi:membrane protein YqaA with SNARE-associated domain